MYEFVGSSLHVFLDTLVLKFPSLTPLVSLFLSFLFTSQLCFLVIVL
jgi:hypothetical protein